LERKPRRRGTSSTRSWVNWRELAGTVVLQRSRGKSFVVPAWVEKWEAELLIFR
jgi:hypothetical protein